MAYYEKNQSGDLVPIKGDVPEEAILAIEKYDDASIVRSMTSGVAAEAFIYRYNIQTATGQKEIIGISTDGSYELARYIGNLEALNDARIDKDSDPDYIYAMIRVKNLERNTTLLGVGRTCKFMLDRGNRPIRDRLNEHAFVSAISKAQRNGILHHASEEIITNIINTWARTGKQARINPPAVQTEKAVKPATVMPATVAAAVTPPEKTSEVIAKQQQKLAAMRTQITNRFANELDRFGADVYAIIKTLFQIDGGLEALSEAQLNQCNVFIDEMVRPEVPATEEKHDAPPAAIITPTTPQISADKAKSLGFANDAEQNALRGRLFTLLANTDNLGMTVEQAKIFVGQRGFASTSDAPKDELNAMIKEATEMVEIKNNPPDEQQLF